MKKCFSCGEIFETPKWYEEEVEGRHIEEYEGCPECASEDYTEYDEGYEAYNSTQRCPHERTGWEDE